MHPDTEYTSVPRGVDTSLKCKLKNGGVFNDRVTGGVFNDRVKGGVFNDRVKGGVFNDRVKGVQNSFYRLCLMLTFDVGTTPFFSSRREREREGGLFFD